MPGDERTTCRSGGASIGAPPTWRRENWSERWCCLRRWQWFALVPQCFSGVRTGRFANPHHEDFSDEVKYMINEI